jgi:hypothetical protein
MEATDDPVLHGDYWNGFLSAERLKYRHLIIHSDAEGFHVPIDFAGARFGTNDIPLLGGMLGSTRRLRAER